MRRLIPSNCKTPLASAGGGAEIDAWKRSSAGSARHGRFNPDGPWVEAGHEGPLKDPAAALSMHPHGTLPSTVPQRSAPVRGTENTEDGDGGANGWGARGEQLRAASGQVRAIGNNSFQLWNMKHEAAAVLADAGAEHRGTGSSADAARGKSPPSRCVSSSFDGGISAKAASSSSTVSVGSESPAIGADRSASRFVCARPNWRASCSSAVGTAGTRGRAADHSRAPSTSCRCRPPAPLQGVAPGEASKQGLAALFPPTGGCFRQVAPEGRTAC